MREACRERRQHHHDRKYRMAAGEKRRETKRGGSRRRHGGHRLAFGCEIQRDPGAECDRDPGQHAARPRFRAHPRRNGGDKIDPETSAEMRGITGARGVSRRPCADPACRLPLIPVLIDHRAAPPARPCSRMLPEGASARTAERMQNARVSLGGCIEKFAEAACPERSASPRWCAAEPGPLRVRGLSRSRFCEAARCAASRPGQASPERLQPSAATLA